MTDLTWLSKLNSASNSISPIATQAQAQASAQPTSQPSAEPAFDAQPFAPTQPLPEPASQPVPQPTVELANNVVTSHGSAELDMDAAYLASMGMDPGLTLADIGVGPNPSVSGFNTQIELTPAEVPVSPEQHYSNVVAQMMQINSALAKQIESLRLYESPLVGIITTPEMAADHITRCHELGLPVMGNVANEDIVSTSLSHKQYIERRYRGHKLKRQAVDAARKAWKKAVEDRKQAMLDWDNYVKYLHSEFNRISKEPASNFDTEANK